MSDKVEIPDEAVGAAARAYYENLGWDWDDLGGWHEDKQRELDHEESKATILREFRAALEAAIPLLPASGGPAVAPTLHEQWHLDHPGYPCEYAEDAAAARTPAVDRQEAEADVKPPASAGLRQVIERVLNEHVLFHLGTVCGCGWKPPAGSPTILPLHLQHVADALVAALHTPSTDGVEPLTEQSTPQGLQKEDEK